MHDAHKVSVSHLGLTIPETVYAMFQATFAIITPALICGSFAERMKFSAMLWFMGIWLIVVYCPVAHWMWEPSGWFAATQLDFAGGTVVHINAGIAGLATALMLGKRQGLGRESMAPHNLTLTVIGASLLWVGWFGFNAGSAVASDGRAGMALPPRISPRQPRRWPGCSPSGWSRASRACWASARGRSPDWWRSHRPRALSARTPP